MSLSARSSPWQLTRPVDGTLFFAGEHKGYFRAPGNGACCFGDGALGGTPCVGRRVAVIFSYARCNNDRRAASSLHMIYHPLRELKKVGMT